MLLYFLYMLSYQMNLKFKNFQKFWWFVIVYCKMCQFHVCTTARSRLIFVFLAQTLANFWWSFKLCGFWNFNTFGDLLTTTWFMNGFQIIHSELLPLPVDNVALINLCVHFSSKPCLMFGFNKFSSDRNTTVIYQTNIVQNYCHLVIYIIYWVDSIPADIINTSIQSFKITLLNLTDRRSRKQIIS